VTIRLAATALPAPTNTALPPSPLLNRTPVTSTVASPSTARSSYRARSPSPPERSISPPRSRAEAPRTMRNARDPQYEDHRSVGPLGSSRFEQPWVRPHAATVRDQPHLWYELCFEHPTHDGQFGDAYKIRTAALGSA
jgi:hypothetical protein